MRTSGVLSLRLGEGQLNDGLGHKRDDEVATGLEGGTLCRLAALLCRVGGL